MTDPTGYDKRDRDENSGLNFRQTIWGWFDKVQDGTMEYGKGTRYEARWDLLDSNRLTIKSGTFEAKTEGDTMDRDPIFESDPSTYYPPSWGIRYVKVPKWDYVLISDSFGYAGAAVRTQYKAGSTESTLYSRVYIGTIPLPGPFKQIDSSEQR
ncbi:hypothetical protein LOK74_23495 [Brevibacillus humidisoli]|uniref:hypothetical protein n=1 Tax=Brevibacillus humidisoli TaxID=2895522 RepID=UPI001E45ABF2|nr:hypothetical protein [Brevibacillus humidisoli]UFJ40915.1 hypothetical protein LOK74_23495 [Brevibacillus humidisoli]